MVLVVVVTVILCERRVARLRKELAGAQLTVKELMEMRLGREIVDNLRWLRRDVWNLLPEPAKLPSNESLEKMGYKVKGRGKKAKPVTRKRGGKK
jgi:hypothetical protein